MNCIVLLPLILLTGAAERSVSGLDSLQRALYGVPRDVSLDQVLESPADFEGRAVHVRGRVGRARTHGQFQLESRGTPVGLEPILAVAARVRAQAPTWVGRDVDLVGVLVRDRRGSAADGSGLRYVLRFWAYSAPAPQRVESEKVPSLTLEQLVYSAGKADGAPVKVVGQFRGNNQRGDLPVASRRGDADWVIKDDYYAVWITGHGPSGDGFELDPLALDDQESWVQVVGRPVTRDGITYLDAQRVSLTEPPVPGAAAKSTPARNALAAIPPAVVFTLPVNGEVGLPADTRLVVQFNKSMDEGSFAGRVRLRRAEGGTVEEVRLAYDETRHALVVEPARPLPAGRELVLELLDGIIDVHGHALKERGRATAAAGAVEAVRFRVGG